MLKRTIYCNILNSLIGNIVFRIFFTGCFLLLSFIGFSQQTLRTNLFIVGSNGSKTLVDGNMTIYDDSYCNCVNWEDALKMTNPGENWGLLRSGTTLSVERRKVIPETDTSFIKMVNLQQRNYVIQIIGRNLVNANRTAHLKDSYTNINTTINLADTSYINFSVNSNSGSASQNRFSIVFEKPSPPPSPLIFTSFKLLRDDAFVNVEFAVENEKLINSYTIQHSTDTFNFKDLKQVAPRNGNGIMLYKEEVGEVSEGEHFYRIKAKSISGQHTYSTVAKISILRSQHVIKVFPNPSPTKQFQLQTSSIDQGKYELKLIGANGITYALGTLQINNFKSVHRIHLPAGTKSGMYSIQLISTNQNRITRSFILL